MAEGAMRTGEVGDRRSIGTQGSPQRHQGESTLHGQPQARTGTVHLPTGPRNTVTLLGLTGTLTSKDKEATSIMAKRESNVKGTSPILRISHLSSTGCLQTPSSGEAAGAAAQPGHQFGFHRSQTCTRSRMKQKQVATYRHRVLHGGVHFSVPQVDVSPAGSPQ